MGLFSVFFGRNDVSPVTKHSISDIGFDPDAMLTEEPDDPDFRMAGLRLGIVYRDAQGNTTQRVIRLKRLAGSHFEGYLTAHCELRNEIRTFITSRIQTLYDPATGEVVPSAEDFFGPYFDEKEAEQQRQFERSKYRLAWNVIEALRDELQVLILVARCDGRFVRAEKEALLKFASVRAHELGLAVDDKALIVLRDWIQFQDPSEPEMRVAIKTLASRLGSLQALWEVSELIAEADGKYKPEERATVSEIRTVINQVAQSLA
jgi:tellurite resistance protein